MRFSIVRGTGLLEAASTQVVCGGFVFLDLPPLPAVDVE
jgi:hypothetical protein